jgi:hypothetical protein
MKLFQGFYHFKDLLWVLILLGTQMTRNQDQVVNKSDHCIIVPHELLFKFWQMVQWILAFGVIKIVELLFSNNDDGFGPFLFVNCIIMNGLEFFYQTLISFLCKDNVNIFLFHGI